MFECSCKYIENFLVFISFLKPIFSFDFLRKLVRILQRFRCFQRACGLREVPRLSTFSRAAKWFREQGFSVFYVQLLKDLEVNHAD
jgi:hypothetical protein